MKTLAKAVSLFAACAVILCSCQTKPASSAADTSAQTTVQQAQASAAETPAPEQAEPEVYPLTKENVKLIGRTYSEDGTLWISQSASGFEFTFTGKKASVTLVGDASADGNEGDQARFAVYVDGERTLDDHMNAKEKEIELFSSDSEKETTVKLIKLSEAANSAFGAKSLKADAKIAPTAEKALKIEFIGDSITCGYGVDDENRNHHFSTLTEDATKAYAVKTAQLLDADYSLVSYSGHGIISGYSGNGKKVPSQQLPKFYSKVMRSYGSSNGSFDTSAEWDFAAFVPDIVVINLGTNDSSYTKGDAEKIEDYTSSYVDFLKTVRKDNEKAAIVCVLGIMGAELYDAVEDAAGRYSSETGDTNIYTLKLSAQDGSLGYAADWHPTEATHEKAANELADFLKAKVIK